jgi:hypothetical protein
VGRPVGDGGKPVAEKKLKTITAPLTEVPPLPPLSLRFAEWVARYTLAPLGMVVRMMMGSSAVFEPVKPRFGVKRNDGAPEPPRMTPARKRALEIAADGLIRAKGVLAAEAGCSTGVIDGLIAAGTLVEVAIPERRLPVPNSAHARTDLTDAQARAAHAMRAAADAQAFSVTLLDGVTGSARPRSTSRPWRARWSGAGRPSSCCPRSRSPASSWTASRRASAARRWNGIPRSLRASEPAPGALPPTGRRASSSAPVPRSSCPSRTSA